MQEAREGKLEVSSLGSPAQVLLYAVALSPLLPLLGHFNLGLPRCGPWWMTHPEITLLGMD